MSDATMEAEANAEAGAEVGSAGVEVTAGTAAVTAPLTVAALWMIRAYQAALRPFAGPSCRFVPSCSEYAEESLRVHGLGRGVWLAVRRICRCHPLGGSGLDPVPEARG